MISSSRLALHSLRSLHPLLSHSSISSLPSQQSRSYSLALPQAFTPYPSSKVPPTFHPVSSEHLSLLNLSRSKRHPPDFPPLTDLLPGSVDSSEGTRLLSPTLQTSTLSNGIVVATQETSGPACSIELLVKGGTANEPEDKTGLVHLLQLLSFQNISSDPEALQFMETSGGNLFSSGLAEYFTFSGDCLHQHLPQVIHYIQDAVRKPTFHDEDIEYYKDYVVSESEMAQRDPTSWIPEAFKHAAYSGSTFGNSFKGFGKKPNCNASDLLSFHRQHFHAGNITISAVGVRHEEFVHLMENAFGDMERRLPTQIVPQRYCGNNLFHIPTDEDYSHVAIGFEGCSIDDKDVYAYCVLNHLMGGGHSFSAGGPGKGMYSRMFLNVLNRQHAIKTAISYNDIFKNTGAFYFFASTEYARGALFLLEVLCSEFAEMASRLDPVEVDRAKNRLAGNLFTQLESRLNLVNDIAVQIGIAGDYLTPQEHHKKIMSVTMEDLCRVARKIVSGKPTVVVNTNAENMKDIPPIAAVGSFFEHVRKEIDKI